MSRSALFRRVYWGGESARHAEGGEVDLTRESEAAALRELWHRLQAEGDVLAVTTERLKDSGDAAALRAHEENVQRHHTKVQAFHAAMEEFHSRYGSVGDL